MSKKINPFVYWAPRIISIVFISFLFYLSLDALSMGRNIRDSILLYLQQNIPAIILLIALIISWKYEIIGAVTFGLAGLIFTGFIIRDLIMFPFEGYIISYTVIIALPLFLIGILFWKNWKFKKNK